MICNTCGKDKPLDNFYIDKNGYRRKRCKQCCIAKSKESQVRNKEFRKEYCREYHKKHCDKRKEMRLQYRDMVNAFKTPCLKCGDTRLYVIDFHHIVPKTKSFNINRKSCKSNLELLKTEVDKCVSLCRNCHMEFHHFYGQNPDNPVDALIEYLGRSDF